MKWDAVPYFEALTPLHDTGEGRGGACPLCGSGQFLVKIYSDGTSDPLCPNCSRADLIEAARQEWRRQGGETRNGASPQPLASNGRADPFEAITEDEWEEPLDLFAREVPPFPVETLPLWLGAQCLAVGVATQTAADVAAMLGLTALAAACQKRVEVWPREDWSETLSLWVAAALPSGNVKTGIFNHMIAPFLDYEAEQTENMRSTVAAALIEREIIEGRIKRLQQQAVKCDSVFDRQKMTTEAAELAAVLAGLPPTASPRYLADDATPEKLAMIMAEQGERIALMSDEANVFEIMAGRYTSGQTNFTFYLKAHTGSLHIVDRIGRPSLTLKRPALSMGLTCQPDVLVRLSEKPEFRDRGLLARFLYCLPRSWVGERDIDPPGLPPGIAAEYHGCLSRLLAMPAAINERGLPASHRLCLDAEATVAFVAFRGWLEPQLGESGPLGYIADWGSKLTGVVLRLAALLHLADRARQDEPWAELVDADTVGRAVTICEYLIEHAHAAFRLIGSDPAVADARKILGWVRRQNLRAVTLRDLHHGLQGTFRKVEELNEPVALLVDHHYFRVVPIDKKNTTGRPASVVFEINPAVWKGTERGIV